MEKRDILVRGIHGGVLIILPDLPWYQQRDMLISVFRPRNALKGTDRAQCWQDGLDRRTVAKTAQGYVG